MSFIGYIGLYWFSGTVRASPPESLWLWKGTKATARVHLPMFKGQWSFAICYFCVSVSLAWCDVVAFCFPWKLTLLNNPLRGNCLGTKWIRGVYDPADLFFIGVKGQIEIRLSAERLNPVTKVTLCATRMARVTSANILHTDFHLACEHV